MAVAGAGVADCGGIHHCGSAGKAGIWDADFSSCVADGAGTGNGADDPVWL